jgi:hypothetical protein
MEGHRATDMLNAEEPVAIFVAATVPHYGWHHRSAD